MDNNGADAGPSPGAPTGRSARGGTPRTSATTQTRIDSRRQIKRRGWRAYGRTALRTVLVIVIILGGVLGVAAFRLSHGPISLSAFKTMIETAVTAELGGSVFLIRDAQLSLGADGLEIALIDVRVTEANGAPVVQAPRALIGVSGNAALSGRLGFWRVDLVNPRLQLFYAEDGTLSVKFAQSAEAPPPVEPPASAATTATAEIPTASPAASPNPIDFVKAVTGMSAQARRRENISAFLREVGMRQATVIVDNGRRKTIWNVPEIKIDLSHKASGSFIAGRAVVNSLTGPVALDFQTVEVAASEQLSIRGKITGVNPRGLSRLIPAMAAFEQFDVPLDGEGQLDLTSKGAVSAANFALTARTGRILVSANDTSPVGVEAGSVKGSYDPEQATFHISEASLSVDRNRVDIAGAVTRAKTPSSDGLPLWQFQFASTGGYLAPAVPDGPSVPLDRLSAQGQWIPEAGQLLFDEIVVRAGGAALTAAAQISDLATDASRTVNLDARLAPMQLNRLLALWPSVVAPDVRSWLGAHLTKGQLTAGAIKLGTSGDTRVSLSLEIGGAEIFPVKGGPAIEIPRGLVRLEGGNVEATIPDATIGAEGKRLILKGVRLTTADTADGTPPVGEIVFRVLGPLAAAVELADREPFKLLKSKGIALQSPEGRLDGQFKLVFPLMDKVQWADMHAEGRLRLTDGRLRQVLGSHDITGAKFDIDVSDTTVDGRGDFLFKGVPVRFAGQHFLNTTADRQSPMRLTLKLDDADRTGLGLDINDLVTGEVPLEITIGPDVKGDYQAHLSADLTKAEVTLDAVAYRKPPGVQARLQFDPAKAAQGRTELRNFKIVGDTIAAEGLIVLGPDGKARELSFPDFSLNVVSRLDVQGRLRPDRIWEVRAKGATFDGRDLFRDLFNVQHQSKPVPKDKPGLDLNAEIETVLGFSDTNLKAVHLTMLRRNDNGIEKTVALEVTAKHENGKPFDAHIGTTAGERKLTATSQDAGLIFKAIGFYPNAAGGRMHLDVALDGRGAVERNGLLRAENFAVFGDPVVNEVFQPHDGTSAQSPGRRKVVRERIDFDWMQLPFSVGCGQFVMNDVEIRGPLVGARLRGKADFKSQRLQIGGTYIPLSGLNSAIGGVPLLGQLLAGPKGEGILGITFAVQGPMANPEVLVNPLSGIVPGILRETQQLTPDSYKITSCLTQPNAPQRGDGTRASSAGPTTAGRNPVSVAPRPQPADVLSDWSSDQKSDPRTRAKP